LNRRPHAPQALKDSFHRYQPVALSMPQVPVRQGFLCTWRATPLVTERCQYLPRVPTKVPTAQRRSRPFADARVRMVVTYLGLKDTAVWLSARGSNPDVRGSVLRNNPGSVIWRDFSDRKVRWLAEIEQPGTIQPDDLLLIKKREDRGPHNRLI
jgi:hypothetical protein